MIISSVVTTRSASGIIWWRYLGNASDAGVPSVPVVSGTASGNSACVNGVMQQLSQLKTAMVAVQTRSMSA